MLLIVGSFLLFLVIILLISDEIIYSLKVLAKKFAKWAS